MKELKKPRGINTPYVSGIFFNLADACVNRDGLEYGFTLTNREIKRSGQFNPPLFHSQINLRMYIHLRISVKCFKIELFNNIVIRNMINPSLEMGL